MAAPERVIGVKEAVARISTLRWNSGEPVRSGQPVKDMYVTNRAVGGIKVTQLTALWGGAEKLAGDPNVREVRLERNPNRYLDDMQDATILTVDRVNGNGVDTIRSQVIYKDNQPPQGDSALIQSAGTIFANIDRELRKFQK